MDSAGSSDFRRMEEPARLSPREFFESQILPQVRDVIRGTGVLGLDDPYTIYSDNLRQEERQRNEAEQAERNQQGLLESLRGTPVRAQYNFPTAASLRGLGSGYSNQPGIPGLLDQVEESNEGIEKIRTQRISEVFDNLLTKYPELNSILSIDPNERDKASRVRKAGFAPYLNYVDKEQVYSAPEDRAGLYNKILNDPDYVVSDFFDVSELAEGLKKIEQAYTSGDTQRQTEARNLLQNILRDPADLSRIETPAFRETRPVIGGGRYVDTKDNPLLKKINQRAKDFNSLMDNLNFDDRWQLASTYPGLKAAGYTGSTEAGFYLDPDTKEVIPADFDDPEAYAVDVSRSTPSDLYLKTFDSGTFDNNQISENALRFLADYPVTSSADVSFQTRAPGDYRTGYSARVLPSELVNPITSFVSDVAFRNLRPGTLVTNRPLASDDLVETRLAEGKTIEESSTLRRLQPFIEKREPLPNLRGLAYSSAGFGPVGRGQQSAFVDDKNQVIPLQLTRPESPLSGLIRMKSGRSPEAYVYGSALPASATPRYYGLDPVTAAASAVPDVMRNIRRTPASLLPGVADLIPSPEAIRTGYSQGPVEMGKQMAQEFAQSLPGAAGAAALLSAPAAAPFAPGIGAGMVGVAGTQALNEVVRQQTGEGILSKLRQAIGTERRTGVSAPARQGERPLTAQIRPLTQAQRGVMNRQASENELQRRLRLVGERFNPQRLEFGLSEIISGR